MNYTSIEQSKRLLELGLNPESADMYYNFYRDEWNKVKSNSKLPSLMMYSLDDIPCWSVGALMEIIPYELSLSTYVEHRPIIEKVADNEYSFKYIDISDKELPIFVRRYGKTPIDAIYNGIVWLFESGYIKKGE